MEKIRKLDKAELEQISGGLNWRDVCRKCGGLLVHDPNVPSDLYCRCNEDNKPPVDNSGAPRNVI